MLALWNQIKLYKNLILLFWVFNLVCVFSSLILAYSYFTTDSSAIDRTQNKILSYQVAIKNIYLWESQKSEKSLFKVNKNLADLNIDYKIPMSHQELSENKAGVVDSLIAGSEREQRLLIQLRTQLDDKRLQLILIGVLSLIFGIVLPGLLGSLITKLSLKAKKSLEDKVKAWLTDWHNEAEKHQEAFKNPAFWTRISVISIEHFSPLVNHPAAKYIGQLSKEIHRELDKKHPTDEPVDDQAA